MLKKSSVIFKGSTKIKSAESKYRTHSEVNRSSDIQKGNSHQKASKELDKLARGSARVILDVKAVFPFDFFPDEVVVDETKVSILTNYFFYTKEVRSVEFKDIFNVIAQQGLFFAKLEIIDRFFSQQTIVVEYLKKKDAILARRVIQGMIIATKNDIDTQALPINELMQKLDRIGQSR